jgi:hypothetical protein
MLTIKEVCGMLGAEVLPPTRVAAQYRIAEYLCGA